ncbi:hypothetical protein P3X46_027515 [Hevea brasiliensis]|uniref:Uncharacterized protein n=1 Tax=Hevea brasiliensis TaxID=3981 RepID=A0ABQ9L029_HEVBR|nr:hypothetical protein P3X46_027515 [Hevea brasiliensis]
MSTQALVDHIESHMKDEGSSSRSQPNLMPCQRNPFNNPTSQASLQPTLPFPLNNYNLASFQERSPIFSATPLITSQRPSSEPQVSLLGVRSNYTIESQQVLFPRQSQRKAIEEPPSDFTKPFLQQLEKPYPHKTERKNRSDLDMLDLSLKL